MRVLHSRVQTLLPFIEASALTYNGMGNYQQCKAKNHHMCTLTVPNGIMDISTNSTL